MQNSTKLILVTAILGTLGIGALVKVVQADQLKPQVAVMSQNLKSKIAEASDGDGETHDDATSALNSNKISQAQAMPSTEKAESSEDEKNDDLKEQQALLRLQPLAKITLQQALQVAQTTQSGKATSVELENEAGNLVYSVSIGLKEVIVDAGNGRILYTDDLMNQKNEATRPRSSIQVPPNRR